MAFQSVSVIPGGTGQLNAHFAVNSATKRGNVLTMEGEVSAANDPANVGMPVTLVAELRGDWTWITITLGEHTFRGTGVQKVREAANR